ncbi:MAG: hypothetical protein LAT67_00245 [Balneolales bacterium]|nr:hypothetical protein [Balneolales bacterium]
MPFSWKLESIAPHDFYISLNIDSYFDKEHNPVEIADKGFIRPVPAGDRDVIVCVQFNGDPEKPFFEISCDELLTDDEKAQANKSLSRILGTDLDLKPLYKAVEKDPVLSDKIRENYGFKRMSRANFYEDAINRIIIAQISHKPTAKKMVYGVREQYGSRLESSFGAISAWPRPFQLMKADPLELKKHGLSLRKGEYIVGLAHELVSGNVNIKELEDMSPLEFYEKVLSVRGIGPTTAQDLMMMRNRPDASFPSNHQKGEEKGLRRWISYSYGENPDTISEKKFSEKICSWKGYEAMALEYLYLDWVLSEKKKAQKK